MGTPVALARLIAMMTWPFATDCTGTDARFCEFASIVTSTRESRTSRMAVRGCTVTYTVTGKSRALLMVIGSGPLSDHWVIVLLSTLTEETISADRVR